MLFFILSILKPNYTIHHVTFLPISVILTFLYCLLGTSLCACVLQNNPVNSVIFLILSFLNLSVIFGFSGAHYMGLVTILIYGGAISILFIFVFTLIDFKYISKKIYFLNYYVYSFLFFFIFLFLFYIFLNKVSIFKVIFTPLFYKQNFFSLIYSKTEMFGVGFSLFNFYYFYFVVIIFILLSAMISVIIIASDREDLTNLNFQNNVIKISLNDIGSSSKI